MEGAVMGLNYGFDKIRFRRQRRRDLDHERKQGYPQAGSRAETRIVVDGQRPQCRHDLDDPLNPGLTDPVAEFLNSHTETESGSVAEFDCESGIACWKESWLHSSLRRIIAI